MPEMKQRMLRGELYLADDPEIQAERRGRRPHGAVQRDTHAQLELRDPLLRELLGEVGEGVAVRPPLWIDYGSNISIGAETFANYDCVLLDVAPIRIGAACQLATRVQLLTATHPIDPEPRRLGWESAAPITIGENVWLGGGAIVCPGVTIGDDTVVGAGAVVTRDLPRASSRWGCRRGSSGRSTSGTRSASPTCVRDPHVAVLVEQLRERRARTTRRGGDPRLREARRCEQRPGPLAPEALVARERLAVTRAVESDAIAASHGITVRGRRAKSVFAAAVGPSVLTTSPAVTARAARLA